MARIRSIKPGFAGDSKVARLSLQARLTFLLLLPEADDEGRMVGSPKRLAGLLFPNDDKVGAQQVTRWVRELEKEAMVKTYEVDGTRYLLITNFKKHQNPQHPTPSTLPPPPDSNVSGVIREPLSKSTGPPHETLIPVLEKELRGSSPLPPDVNHQRAGRPVVEEEDEDQKPEAKIKTTCHRLAERQLARRKGGDPIANRDRWLAAAEAGAMREHEDRLLSELATEPDMTVAQLLAVVDPDPRPPGLRSPDPLEATAAAQYDRTRAAPCPDCESRNGMRVTDAGDAEPCPTCNPVARPELRVAT